MPGSPPRAILLVALSLGLVLAGCLGDETAQNGAADDEHDLTAVQAPALAVGTAFSYEASGLWDLTPAFTVVVAEAHRDGYLFAAAEPDDLRGEVLLERAWFGERDLELNRRPTDGHPEGWTLFDFPLEDGKTWRRGQQPVVAEAATVHTPDGPAPGFRMRAGGGAADFYIQYEYAPSVGYLTRYTYIWDGQVLFDITLDAVSRADTWVWYGEGPFAETTDEGLQGTGTLDVGRGWDALVVYAGGSQGMTGLVVPPVGSDHAPWTYLVDGAEQAFVAELLPAEPGTWTYSAARADGGFSYLGLVAVTWIRGEVPSSVPSSPSPSPSSPPVPS